MLPLVLAAMSLATPPQPPATTADQLCFVTSLPGGSARLTLVKPLGGTNEFPFGPLSLLLFGQSDKTFFRYAGKQPIRAVFGADPDGDLTDELFVLREVAATGEYLLSKHHTSAFENTGSPFSNMSLVLARTEKNAIGARPLFGAIVAADGIDLDGDLRDEWLVVRQVDSGEQRLEVYRLPFAAPESGAKKSKPISKDLLGSAIAAYLEFGDAVKDRVEDIAAVDISGDGVDEIAILRRAFDGSQSIEVVPAPAGISSIPPVVLSSAPIVLVGGAPPTLEIEGIDIDGDGRDEFVTRRPGLPFSPSGQVPTTDHFDILDPRSLPTDATNPPNSVISSPTHVSAMDDLVVLRGPNPKPGGSSLPLDVLLNDSFHGDLTHSTVDGGYLGASSQETLAKFEGVLGKLDGSTFTLDLPGSSAAVGGTIDPVTGSIEFDDVAGTGAESSIVVPMPNSNSTLELQFSSLRVITFGPIALIQGEFTGNEIKPSGATKALLGGTLEFRNDL